MPEPMFERLYRETTTMNWEPPEVIRRRGQRRTAIRRTALRACSFVALALIAVGASLYLQRPNPVYLGIPPLPPPTSTSHPESEATIPAYLMLDWAEVPGISTGSDSPKGGYDGTLEPLVGRCGKGEPLRRLIHAARDRSFELTNGGSVYQVVNQYASAADAVRALDWYRDKVAACPRFDPGGGERTLTIIAQNVAGDESMTVQDKASSDTDLHVFVSVRNRLTEIVVDPADATLGRELALKAASRLSSAP